MRRLRITTTLALGLLAMLAGPVSAQTWDKAQTEVWEAVLGSYADIDSGNANWTDKWVLEDAMVWGGSNPMPRSRASSKKWDQYRFPNSTTKVSEYSPAAIVVHGSTAVAHYYYSNATESKKGELDTSHGRCSDVLVKEKNKWRFIAWHCTDEPSD